MGKRPCRDRHPDPELTADSCYTCRLVRRADYARAWGEGSILHIMNHGLGDCVQCACVIRHMSAEAPGVKHHVVCQRGKEAPFRDLATVHLSDRRDYVPPGNWSRVIRHPWHNPDRSYPDCPSTKATHYLRETEKMAVVPNFLRYRVPIFPAAQSLADHWLHTHLGERRFAVIHYEGTSWKRHKDLPVEVVNPLLDQLDNLNVVPVLLDWSGRSPVLRRPSVRSPVRGQPLWRGCQVGDAEVLAALMSRSILNVVIDSGPGKVAASVAGVPCITVWRELHPVHFSDLDYGQVLHLIPADHTRWIRGDSRLSVPYFARHYLHRVYSDLPADLVRWATDRIVGDESNAAVRRLLDRTGCILPGNPLAGWSDRDISLSLFYGFLRQRECPTILETGCVREEDDWTAGNSTVVLGTMMQRVGGRLISVDQDQAHVDLARRLSAGLPVKMERGDSVGWLRGYGGPLLHGLYLDSVDVGEPGCEEHCLAEIQAAMPHLAPAAVVLIDDTVAREGRWVGKGSLAVPWLLGRRARLVHSGYQQLLVV